MVLFQPIQGKPCERNFFIRIFFATFAEAADGFVRQHNQAGISCGSRVNCPAQGPRRAFVIAQAHGHSLALSAGWIGKKNPALALNALKAGSAIELGQISFIINISCLYPTYVRGEAYLAAGQGGAAATEFQKTLDHSGIVWNCWTGALAHLGLARANALQARTSQGADADAARVRALAADKDFLTLWKDADPDIPILKQAKAEYAKLQ